jgi:hypothetical protein
MKTFSLLVAMLAVPACAAFAQTPGVTGTATGQAPYIPLTGSAGAADGTARASAWFIDTTQKQIVLCVQSGTGSDASNFTCTAQAVPGPAPTTGEGTPRRAPTPVGGAGTNPMGG